MNKPFNLEAFRNGQKALTRDGRVATFVGICKNCNDRGKVIFHVAGRQGVVSVPYSGAHCEDWGDNLVSMISRHQYLIDSYNPEDTWQEGVIRHGNLESSTFIVWLSINEPNWDEHQEYRLHPHNDLIKAHKKGAKIEICMPSSKSWETCEKPSWYEDTQYRIKPEPKTKTVYEWLLKDSKATHWHIEDMLMTEEEVTIYFSRFDRKKTGRSWEVEV